MIGYQTVIVLRATSSDDAFGNPAYDWANARRTRYSGVSLQPIADFAPSSETAVRQTVVNRWRLRAHSTIDLRSTDRIEYAGDVYEVDGEVQTYGIAPGGYTTALLERSA